MAFQLDGVPITDVKYNGVDVGEVQINGVTVWTRVVVDLSGIPGLISDSAQGSDIVDVRYTFSSNGQHFTKEGDGAQAVRINPDWLASGTPSDYEVRMTITSGDALGGDSTGIWLSAGVTREWYHRTGVDEELDTNVTLEVRLASSQAVQDSRSFRIQAIKEP